MASKGRRAGSRRAAPRRRTFRPELLALAVGVTLAVVAWGYLVYAAIDFGASARGGDSQAWWFLALASVGAIACLFAGLMLVARLLRGLGITSPPPAQEPTLAHDPAGPTGPGTPEPPDDLRPPGGHRAAR